MHTAIRSTRSLLTKLTVYGTIGSGIAYSYPSSSSSSGDAVAGFAKNSGGDADNSILYPTECNEFDSILPLFSPPVAPLPTAYSPSSAVIQQYTLQGPGIDDIENENVIHEHRTKQSFMTVRIGIPLDHNRNSNNTPIPSSTSNLSSTTVPTTKDTINESIFTKFPVPFLSTSSSSPSSSSLPSSSSIPPKETLLRTSSSATVSVGLLGASSSPSSSPSSSSSYYYLLGCNVRCMLGWCKLAIARGYAYGLYLDKDSLYYGTRYLTNGTNPSSSSSFPSSSSSSLPLSSSSFPQYLASKQTDPSIGEMALVLKMARDIPGEHMSHGFRNSLLNKLRSLTANPSSSPFSSVTPTTVYPVPDRTAALQSGSQGQNIPVTLVPSSPNSTVSTGTHSTVPAQNYPSSSAASASSSSSSVSSSDSSLVMNELTTFADAFRSYSFRSSDEISLVWNKDGQLIVAINNQYIPQATLTQPILIRALFDIYCGEAAVSLRARDTFRTNYHSLIHAPILVPSSSSVPSPSTSSSSSRQKDSRGKDPSVGVTINTDEVLRIVLQEHCSRTK